MINKTIKNNTLRNGFKNFEPTVYLFPTMKCNLDCQMCYSGSSLYKSVENELSDNAYFVLVDKLIDLGFYRFDISGGEPLLRYNLIYMLAKRIKNRNAKLQLVTNGTLLNNVLSENILKPDHFDFIAVSLDSPYEETYNRIRGGRAFNSVISGINELVDKGFCVGLNAVCMNENKNQISELLHFAEYLGVNFVHLLRNRQVSPLIDILSSSFRINWINIYEDLQSELSSAHDDLLVVVNLPQYIHNDFNSNLRSCFRDKKNILILTDCVGGCGAFNKNIAITSTGDVTGCVAMINESKFWIGNICNSPLSKMLEKAEGWTMEFDKRSKNLCIDSVCAFCLSYRFCKCGCPVMAQKTFSDWRARDSSCNVAYDSCENILKV